MTCRLNCSTSNLSSSGAWVEIDLAGLGIEQLQLVTGVEDDAGLAELGLDLVGRLVVDEIAVDHRLAVGIGEDRIAEDLSGVKRRRGGQADLDGIEVLQYAAVFGDVVVLAAELQLGVGHLTIK